MKLGLKTVVLALVLLLALSAVAFAGDKGQSVIVSGVNVNTTNGVSYFVSDGNGSITATGASAENYDVKFDRSSFTLTMGDIALTKAGSYNSFIRLMPDAGWKAQDLNIVLEGDVTMDAGATLVNNLINVISGDNGAAVTISGEGSLTGKCNTRGIVAVTGITVKDKAVLDMTVTSTSGSISGLRTGAYNKGGDIVIDNATVKMKLSNVNAGTMDVVGAETGYNGTTGDFIVKNNAVLSIDAIASGKNVGVLAKSVSIDSSDVTIDQNNTGTNQKTYLFTSDGTYNNISGTAANPALNGVDAVYGNTYGGASAVTWTSKETKDLTIPTNNQASGNSGPSYFHTSPVYTVTYTDGVDGEVVFADQVKTGLHIGDNTPAFDGTPTREGFTFIGWSPVPTAKVTGNAVYVAQWTPFIPQTPDVPETGDATPPMLFAMLMLAAAAGMLAMRKRTA